ncbi:MAG: serine hydrolase domain-containing protein [Flavobacteriales bacterium]
MKLNLLLLVCLLSAHSTFSQRSEIHKLDGSVIPTTEIDQIVLSLMDSANVDGLSLAILNNSVPVYVKAYGYKNKPRNELLDTATINYAASFSKVVFAVLVLRLNEQGTIDLDKPLYEYLKKPLAEYEDYAELATDDRYKAITARMCLSHTTGLPNIRYIHPTTGELDTLGTMKIYFTPGSRYAYSGEGIKFLQLAVEDLTGKNVEELAEEQIFIPLHMLRTGYTWHESFGTNVAIGHLNDGRVIIKKPRNTPNAAGSLVTTISDYSKFISALLQGKLLSAETFAEMIKPQIKINSKFQFPTITDETTTENDAIDLSYGLGWVLLDCNYGRAFFKEGHSDAWRNYNINFVDKGISVIIICNSENGEALFKELLENTIGDTCTPWKWEGYVPYGHREGAK